MEDAMRMTSNQANGLDEAVENPAAHSFDKQRLRILRCTARAMAAGPGGLRFRAGTQPWLDGIPVGKSAPGYQKRCQP